MGWEVGREGVKGIWDMGYGIWDMGYGIWNMGYGIWNMEYGIWDMESGERRKPFIYKKMISQASQCFKVYGKVFVRMLCYLMLLYED